jgi:hypothetical protein
MVSDDLININIRYVEKKTKGGQVVPAVIGDDDEETAQRYGDAVRQISTMWTQPTWKENNEIRRQCSKWDPQAGGKLLDWPLYERTVLEKFMRKWDIVDDDGNPIPCTQDNINNLQPAIAMALLAAFWDKSTLSEEEVGN